MPRLSTGALLAVVSALAYGSLAIFAKLAYREGWETASLLTVRFAIAALVVLPFALSSGRRTGVGTSAGTGASVASWRGWPGAFLVGALGYTATTALFFPSLRLLPAAVASFLLFLAPPFIALLARVFLKERLGARGLVALGLALLGMAFIASGAFTGVLPVLGVLLAAGSAVTYSLTILASRVVVRGLDWRKASVATCAGAATSFFVFALATGQLDAPESLPGVAYALAIGVLATGVALSLFFAALPRIGASRAALISNLEPVSTLALAAVFLLEIPAWTSLVGGGLIVVAAALVATEASDEEGLPTAGP